MKNHAKRNYWIYDKAFNLLDIWHRGCWGPHVIFYLQGIMQAHDIKFYQQYK